MKTEMIAPNAKISRTDFRKQKRAKQNFYGELLADAEREWTECVRDPRSDRFFHVSGGWFESSEKEMKRVYALPWIDVRLDKDGAAKKRENDRESSRWLVKRYAMGYTWIRCLRHPASFFGWHMFLPQALASIGAAWYTFALASGMELPRIMGKANLSGFLTMEISFLFVCILILMNKFVPNAEWYSIFWRALRLTFVTLFISVIIGGLIYLTIKINPLNPSSTFIFFSVSSAYLGIIVEFFGRGQNPSESV